MNVNELVKWINLFNLRLVKSIYRSLYDSELDAVCSDVDFDEELCDVDI